MPASHPDDVPPRRRHDDGNSSASSSGRSSVAPVRPNARPGRGNHIWFYYRMARVFFVCSVLWVIIFVLTDFLNRVDRFVIPFCLELLILSLSWFLFPDFWTDDRVLGVAIFAGVIARGYFAPLMG
jgi:hypothetical protein